MGTTYSHRAALAQLLATGDLLSDLNTISMSEREERYGIKLPNEETLRLSIYHFTRSNASEDRLNAPYNLLYRHAAFLCYDPMHYGTFSYLKDVINGARRAEIELPKPTYVLAVNAKKPNEQEEDPIFDQKVPDEEVLEFAESIGVGILSCSLYDIKSVQDVFKTLAMDYAKEAGIDINARHDNSQSVAQPSSSSSRKTTAEPQPKRSFFSFFKRQKNPQPQTTPAINASYSPVAFPRTYEGSQYDYSFKIILIGHRDVKKAPLLLTYSSGEPPSRSYVGQIGIDFKIANFLTPSGHKVRLQIWDVAKYTTQSYFRGSNGILLCYDNSESSTFNCLNDVFSYCDRYADLDAAVRIVGISENDSAPQVVSQNEAQALAARNGVNASTCCLENVKTVYSAIDNLVFDIGRKKGIDFTAVRK